MTASCVSRDGGCEVLVMHCFGAGGLGAGIALQGVSSVLRKS